MLVIVPNILRDKINEKLDVALRACPSAEKDRELIYHQILAYFDEHGVIPDFTLVPKAEGQ